jgi:hypothetical protein
MAVNQALEPRSSTTRGGKHEEDFYRIHGNGRADA